MKKIFVVLAVALLLLASASLVLAQDSPPAEGPSIPDAALESPEAFLHWLSVGAAPVLGSLVALLVRKSAWFQALTRRRKILVAFGLGAGLPAAAGFLLLYVPAEFWLALRPAWAIIVPAVLGWMGMEATYLGGIKGRESDTDNHIQSAQRLVDMGLLRDRSGDDTPQEVA